MDFLPIKAADVSIHLVRPLPTILAYARGAQKVDVIPSVLEEEFYSHVDCLTDLLETACLRTQIPASVCKEVAQRAVDLARSEKQNLVARTNDLLFHLTRMSEMHKTALKHEMGAEPQIYRDIYWGRVYTKKVSVIHQEESAEPLAKLVKTLADDCSYEVTLVSEEEIAREPVNADFLIFRPTRGAIRQVCLDTASRLGLPTLVLIDLGKKVETADPVMVRMAHLYAKDGLGVLHRPFMPLRVFSTIDRSYVEHVFKAPAFAGARAQGEVA